MQCFPKQPIEACHDLQFSIFSPQKPQTLFLRSTNNQLNNFFEGGLHRGMITQVYGEAGCGKSQLAMLFALGVFICLVQALSRNLGVCFLATEKQMSWNRFTQLAYTTMNQAEYEQKQKQLMYKKASDFNVGYMFIQQSLKKIKQNGRGGLLIIDSIHTFISSCLQFHNIQSDSYQKSRKQAQIVNRVRWLAKMSLCAVLFTNHASDVMDKRRNSNGRTVVPALGPSWEFNMDQSFYLSKKGEIREIAVVASPKCKSKHIQRFRIQKQGFVWISEEGVQYS